MASHPGKRFADDMLQLHIKQVVAAGLDRAKGTLPIAELSHGVFFPAIVEGHGDYIIVTVHGGWGNTVQGVALTETPCNYGGSRKWFFCPSCRRRCGVLYIYQRIACRRCHGLAYASQYEPACDRMLRQLLKIHRAIGVDMDICAPFNPPPKGMSVKRWRQLIDAFVELREKYWRETGHSRHWRNDAPRAAHWKHDLPIPSPQPRIQMDPRRKPDQGSSDDRTWT